MLDNLLPKKVLLAYSVFFVAIATSGLFYYLYSSKLTNLPTVSEYHAEQVKNVSDFEKLLNGQDWSSYLAEDKADTLLKYANALTRLDDFGYATNASSTVKAVDIYSDIISSNLPQKYTVFAANELFTTFIQSGSDTSVVQHLFSKDDVRNKMQALHFKNPDPEKLNKNGRIIVYQNLLSDKGYKTIDLIPTQIAIARVSMQAYTNQMLFRFLIRPKSTTATEENEKYKQEFSQEVKANYEKYKLASANTIQPDIYYQVEASYLMAWSLNRAGVYTNDKVLVDESYLLFENGIRLAEAMKKNSNDFWHLSVLSKMFYASAVLGSNKDAYIDPANLENRNKALSILSEISSPDFITNDNYIGVRKYLSGMKDSDMDWITTLILLSKYEVGLKNNLQALGWNI